MTTNCVEELTMEYKVGKCIYDCTDVEQMLFEQRGLQQVPFAGMDKTGKSACVLFDKGICKLGEYCPLRHLIGDKQVVCKHWLRGLCKKSDQCEFLHEYDLSKMPECFFFARYGLCSNKECLFRHIDPESKIKDCPWYKRGFCRHGPTCKLRHRRCVLCPNFLCGFCPEGKECRFAHPSFKIPQPEAPSTTKLSNNIVCHNCNEKGHIASRCPKWPPGQFNRWPKKEVTSQMPGQGYDCANFGETRKRDVSTVTCYKCGEMGHYANRCSKGRLAFLSSKTNYNN